MWIWVLQLVFCKTKYSVYLQGAAKGNGSVWTMRFTHIYFLSDFKHSFLYSIFIFWCWSLTACVCGSIFTASDEMKRKMYSCILVVGGGLLFHGAQEFLQHHSLNKMPPSFRRLVENVDVITRPKVCRKTNMCVRAEFKRSYWWHCFALIKSWGVFVNSDWSAFNRIFSRRTWILVW